MNDISTSNVKDKKNDLKNQRTLTLHSNVVDEHPMIVTNEIFNNSIKCCVCGMTQDGYYCTANNFKILKCSSCHLLWTNEATEESINLFYNDKYFNKDNSKMGYRDYLADETLHRDNSKHILQSIMKFRDLVGAKILDVGCAFGFLLDEAQRNYSCDVYGIEISKEWTEPLPLHRSG